MKTLLLQSKSKKDIKIIADLAKKIGLRSRFLTNEHLEDIGIANAMKEGRTGKYVNTQAYLKKLRGNEG